jgi:hypothetical protein
MPTSTSKPTPGRCARAACAAALLLAGCVQVPQGASRSCPGPAAQCAREALETHAIHRLATWDTTMATRPVEQRLAAAPPQLIEYLNLDNIAHGFAGTPRAAVMDDLLVRDVRRAIEEMPAPVLAAVDSRLVGIYFVEGLGSTGFTDVIERGPAPPRAFIVLDAGVLSHLNANAWATWKENTPFAANAAWRLQARLESDADDSREHAIQYILLHELAHVMAAGSSIHPDWGIAPREVKPDARYPFFELSWRIDRTADRYASRWDDAFPQRTRIRYYLGAKLAGADLLPTYENLARTDFPTLYAATSPGDDFAESLASYVHVVLLKRPWAITITGPDGAARTFGSCWAKARCERKRTELEAILRGAR